MPYATGNEPSSRWLAGGDAGHERRYADCPVVFLRMHFFDCSVDGQHAEHFADPIDQPTSEAYRNTASGSQSAARRK
jgi:hypothetical protein